MPQLAENNQCTGCSACKSICPHNCIKMIPDKEGFLVPHITKENCIDCGLCEKTCPILNTNKIKNSEKLLYAAYSKKESVRKKSSSGGIFYEIAKKVLEYGGVVYGAKYDSSFRVVHSKIESLELLDQLLGAKYSQSDLQDCFIEIKSFLQNGRIVLFVGTPCQVAGLKQYLHVDYEKLLCVDFVCHGVPSPHAWKTYVQYRMGKDNNGNGPQKIDLRSKTTGWSKYSYSCEFEYTDKKYSVRCSADLFMRLFIGNYILRKSCGNCYFKGYDRGSDITIGDYWGIWNCAPDMDDNKGTSMVLIHSFKGAELFDCIDSMIIKKQMPLESLAENASILVSSKENGLRGFVMNKILNGNIGFLDTRIFDCIVKVYWLMWRLIH